MNPQRPPVAFRHHGEIAASLRCFYDAESILLPRHGKIGGIVTRDLQKYAGVGAAFVGLPRRVQEARSESETRCDAFFVPHGMAHRLQSFLVLIVHRSEEHTSELQSQS